MELHSSVTYSSLTRALMESPNPVVTCIALIKPYRSQDKPEIMNLAMELAGIEGVTGGTER